MPTAKVIPAVAELMEFIAEHDVLLGWLGVVSLLVFVATLFAVPWFVVRIPEDYFVEEKREPLAWSSHHPLIRWPLLILKNLLGLVLLLMGIAMLVMPGQGLLTMLAGLVLLNFPGKFRLERWLVTHRPVLLSINWMRQRRGAPPLRVDLH